MFSFPFSHRYVSVYVCVCMCVYYICIYAYICVLCLIIWFWQHADAFVTFDALMDHFVVAADYSRNDCSEEEKGPFSLGLTAYSIQEKSRWEC